MWEKTVRAYDLAYLLPSFMRDLLILDQARQYEPDLVVWPVTLLTFQTNDFDRFFLAYQSDRVLQLVKTYHLKVPAASHLRSSGFGDHTILVQRSKIRVVFADQLFGLRWGATGLDADVSSAMPLSNDVASNSIYYGFNSPADLNGLVQSLQFSALDAGQKLAGNVPIYYFNEPIFIAGGKNSSIRYNKYYPRWAYDEYRTRIGQWMAKQNLPYDDFWNIIPPSEFTDTPLHFNIGGRVSAYCKICARYLEFSL